MQRVSVNLNTTVCLSVSIELACGVQGCGVNISKAAVGSVLTVNFLVFDDESPPRNSTAARTLTVISPCASDGSEFLCDDDTCSTIACELR